MSNARTGATAQPAPDHERIMRNHQQELHGWAKAMGTSPERLQRAVQAVGITPRKIRAFLRQSPERPQGGAV